MASIIGLIYGRNENWIAGSYYIQNLVFALKRLENDRPQIKIYAEKMAEFEELKDLTDYPNLKWVPLINRTKFIHKVLNKLTFLFFNKQYFLPGLDRNVDIIFPASRSYFFDRFRTRLFWIPDFQEHHYPNFFTSNEMAARKKFQKLLVKENAPLILSSKSARDDFYTLYPNAKNQVFVMPFAVTLPPDWSIDVNLVRKKFDLEGDYFICSNQFWAHKNHLTVLKALKKMIQSRKGVSVIFTGKPYDNRNPDYYPSLVSWIKDQGLEGSARFIGFIERKEQLTLMKNSLAVIQPSLFEGWSTVVEDAKALGVPILVSDIPVHREQLTDGYPFFFRAEDDNSLAGLMARFPLGITFSYDLDYSESIRAFGANFQRIVSQLR